MFGKWKKKLGGGLNRFAGNTDFLEAVCAASALVTYADGECDDTELDTAIETISNNESLKSGFKASQINQTMDTMLKRAKGGRSGQRALLKELEDIEDLDQKEMTLLCALDVADCGGIDEDEKQVIIKIGNAMGLNALSYL
jgi:tellurite resistance protein